MTTTVLVTGAAGFIGSNLCVALRERKDLTVIAYDLAEDASVLRRGLSEADVVIHLAGVNRPSRVEDYEGNVGSLDAVLLGLVAAGRPAKVILSSSTQAELDNPYGRSKRGAEDTLLRYCEATRAEGVVHRLTNIFGKWCRPNYNSAVATFADAIANDLPYKVSDPAKVVCLTYVDDVVAAFSREIDHMARPGFRLADPLPSHRTTLGDLIILLKLFRAHRDDLVLPDYSQPFVRALYATYLSYVRPETCGYALAVRSDARGSLAEFIKSPHGGQIFVSRTKPGITRGNHYHHTKTEKFMVVQGEGVIRLRSVRGDRVIAFPCRGDEYRVVDIPPGYTHSIENVGAGDMVTLFWSSEVFDPAKPDTIFEPVLRPEGD